MIGDRRKAPSAFPARVLWDGKGSFDGPLDRWTRELAKDEEARRLDDEHPKGALAVLRVLEDARRSGVDGGWVGIDDLMEKSGQRAVHSRIAELNKKGFKTEWNHKGGKNSKHRLVEMPPIAGG